MCDIQFNKLLNVLYSIYIPYSLLLILVAYDLILVFIHSKGFLNKRISNLRSCKSGDQLQ